MLSAIVKTDSFFIHIFHADNQFYIIIFETDSTFQTFLQKSTVWNTPTV